MPLLRASSVTCSYLSIAYPLESVDGGGSFNLYRLPNAGRGLAGAIDLEIKKDQATKRTEGYAEGEKTQYHRAPLYGDATVSRRPFPPCTLTRRGPGVCAGVPHSAPQTRADRRYAADFAPRPHCPGGAASLDPVGLPPGLSADGRRATPIRACILQAYPSRLCRAQSIPSDQEAKRECTAHLRARTSQLPKAFIEAPAHAINTRRGNWARSGGARAGIFPQRPYHRDPSP